MDSQPPNWNRQNLRREEASLESETLHTSDETRSFESAEEALRFDARHISPPPGLKEKIRAAMGGMKRNLPFWRRWFPPKKSGLDE